METKNTILARQKEMQLSLEKVKHLIRLIQAFNFNQALTETEGTNVITRVQDSGEGVISSEPAPEANSVETVKAACSSASSNNEGPAKLEEHGVVGSNPAAGGDADGQPVPEDRAIITAENSPARAGPGAGAGGQTGPDLQPEAEPKAETEAAPMVDIASSSVAATVATTNGTTEAACPDHSPTGNCATNITTNSENKMAAVNSPEMAVEKKQEEITDSDGSNINNRKTSEPSQHSLPALVSSLDNKK